MFFGGMSFAGRIWCYFVLDDGRNNVGWMKLDGFGLFNDIVLLRLCWMILYWLHFPSFSHDIR